MVEVDTSYDTDFAMFYTLYHIFKQESIQDRGAIKGRGMIKGRDMIKGRHLTLYQIFKTTVFTTKYMINMYVIVCILIILYVFVFLFFFGIVIGNKLIKRNYLITFFYYRLITKCN